MCVRATAAYGTMRRGTYVGVARDEVAHVRRGVLIELLVVAEDEDGHINRAQHGEFVRLLEQATLPLQERPWGGVNPEIGWRPRFWGVGEKRELTLSGSCHP